ncbi:hypothetical protein D3C77_258350 [compost metagenome]
MFQRQLLGHQLRLKAVVVDDQDPAARPLEAGHAAGVDADAAAALLALAQFVHDHLQPGQALDPRHQDDVVQRLGQEIVGPRLQPLDTVVSAIQRRHQHNGNMPGVGRRLDAPTGLEPVHAGHHHVQQNQVGLFRARQADGADAVMAGEDVVVFERQLGLEQAHIRLDVVDHQDSRAHAAPCARCFRTVSRHEMTEIGLEI